MFSQMRTSQSRCLFLIDYFQLGSSNKHSYLKQIGKKKWKLWTCLCHNKHIVNISHTSVLQKSKHQELSSQDDRYLEHIQTPIMGMAHAKFDSFNTHPSIVKFTIIMFIQKGFN